MPTSPAATASNAKPFGVGPRAAQIRLGSGLILFSFVATHYLNHMLGLISVEAMETGRVWFNYFWRFPPAEILLAASFVAHASLALLKAARSRSFRMRPSEWAQLACGLAIPFLIAEHVWGTRGLSLRDGVVDNYTFTVLAIWPARVQLQTVAIFTIWAHGCIGLHAWLRLKPWYPPAAPWLLGLAVLWPVLAFLGFADAGQAVRRLAADPQWVRDLLFDVGVGGDAVEWVAARTRGVYLGAGVVVGFAAAWRIGAWAQAKNRRGVKVSYPDGETIEIDSGVSVLEASRLAGVPHASVCGGRGRCSTCRVRISGALDAAPAADEAERKVLARVHAPPGVRLACQLRPTADIAVAPLLPPTATVRDARDRLAHESGAEREIAIMFVDIRAFTKLSEDKLPFDVVFLLNQYFRSMGQAIEQNGGRIDKFIGDGIMALFGIESGAQAGCRQALAAIAEMSRVLTELNASLASDLPEPLRIGVGVHVGPVIVGEMGYADATSVTAIGDAVNVASRLEPMTKLYAAQAVVSEEVLAAAGLAGEGLTRELVEVRGRERPLQVVVLDTGQALAGYLEAAAAEA